MNKYILFFFFLNFLVLSSLSIKAEDTLIYNKNQSVIDIGQFARFHIDGNDSLTLAQVQTLPDAVFQKSETPIMNFGNTTASIGVKLYIKNLTNEPLFISFDNAELQHIEVLTISETGAQLTQIGGNFAKNSDMFFKRSNSTFNIGTKPTLIYIKAKSHSSFYFPVTISTLKTLVDTKNRQDIFVSLLVGIIMAMFLFNLFIFFLVKERVYLLYCLNVLTSAYSYSHSVGLWYYVGIDSQFLTSFVGIQITCITAALFSLSFLKSRASTPRYYQIMMGAVILLAILIPLEYLKIQPFTNNLVQILVTLVCFSLFFAGIYAYIGGNKSAKYYVIAWSFSLTGAIISLLTVLGVVTYHYLTLNAALIGNCFECILLSFALANSIKIYRAESAESQALAFHRLEENERLVKEQNKLLEEKVQERTFALETSLQNLKSTQDQLVQKEKLASLGELTAGIAHEIQNPLNFVNNFSEVSNELIEEVLEERSKEKRARNEELENEILTDIKENLTKINHHGKRASSIVKGMLEHSRKSSGTKEATDINALADECLRLSYHGLKAKDKDFNATMETHFDPNLPKIDIIPQDIGRVLLNLITNAFYEVNEKANLLNLSRQKGDANLTDFTYEPKVSVRTKGMVTPLGAGGEQSKNESIQISISDNGSGIPDAIKDKIFQPFFTTKPTGQGTGLGLSLAYDIVKAHGGEISVESNTNTGTTFTINLNI
jgi:signal transduction histidine kinase